MRTAASFGSILGLALAGSAYAAESAESAASSVRTAVLERCLPFVQGRIAKADVPATVGSARIVIDKPTECRVEVDDRDGRAAVTALVDEVMKSPAFWTPIDAGSSSGKRVSKAKESRFFYGDAQGVQPISLLISLEEGGQPISVGLERSTPEAATEALEMARELPAIVAATDAADRRPLIVALRSALSEICLYVVTGTDTPPELRTRLRSEINGAGFGAMRLRADHVEGTVTVFAPSGSRDCGVMIEGPKAEKALKLVVADWMKPRSGWRKLPSKPAAETTDYAGPIVAGLEVRARAGRAEGRQFIFIDQPRSDPGR